MCYCECNQKSIPTYSEWTTWGITHCGEDGFVPCGMEPCLFVCFHFCNKILILADMSLSEMKAILFSFTCMLDVAYKPIIPQNIGWYFGGHSPKEDIFPFFCSLFPTSSLECKYDSWSFGGHHGPWGKNKLVYHHIEMYADYASTGLSRNMKFTFLS